MQVLDLLLVGSYYSMYLWMYLYSLLQLYAVCGGTITQYV